MNERAADPARLYLVRHGKAAAGFAEARDPGLDPEGQQQAAAMASRLAPLGPMALVVSPMRRARQTAAALERAWSTTGRIEPRVAEVNTPAERERDRSRWIREFMAGTWSAQPAELRAWRAEVLAALAGLGQATVVVSHFVAINAAVGAATGNDRIVAFRPDNCSTTILDARDGALRLVELGREQDTRVL